VRFRNLTILLILSAFTQAQQPEHYPAAALRKDFLLLRTTLETLHPGLYRYKSKKTIDALFDNCYRRIGDSMTLFEFYRLPAAIISAIQDGHAACDPPTSALRTLIDQEKLFPLQLWFRAGKAFVACPRDSLAAGDDVLAIDGHPTSEVIRRLYSLLPSDGAISTGKARALSEGSTFAWLYCVVYGQQPRFLIQYRSSTGPVKEATLPAVYLQGIPCATTKEKPRGLTMDTSSNTVAILTVGMFAVRADYFNRFLQQSFATINRKEYKILIIDLRNNGGGEDGNGAALYSWLTNKTFPYYASLESVQRKYSPDNHAQLKLQQPAPDPFLGRVYFLINGGSFSATAEFCALARSERRGEFIGEETGGGYDGNTSGEDTVLVLPNTRITVDFGLIKYEMAVRKAEHPGRGIIPEHPVTPSITDVIGQKDVQLEYALRLAESTIHHSRL
jgi:hypothetical protein